MLFSDCQSAFQSCRSTKVFVWPQVEYMIVISSQSKPDNRKFTDLEQQANLRLCKRYEFSSFMLCEELCSNDQRIEECRAICRHLADAGTDHCPFETGCPDGCPCPQFYCEKRFIEHDIVTRNSKEEAHANFFNGGTINIWVKHKELSERRGPYEIAAPTITRNSLEGSCATFYKGSYLMVSLRVLNLLL